MDDVQRAIMQYLKERGNMVCMIAHLEWLSTLVVSKNLINKKERQLVPLLKPSGYR